MTKYKVISGIMSGLKFNGHPVNIDGESRIWNEDSTGQSFITDNCQELEECEECHSIDECESILWYPKTPDACFLITCKKCQSEFAAYIETK